MTPQVNLSHADSNEPRLKQLAIRSIEQLAGRLSNTLRVSLYFHEVHNEIGATIRVAIGDPIPYERLAHIRDRRALIDHLHDLTHALALQDYRRLVA